MYKKTCLYLLLTSSLAHLHVLQCLQQPEVDPAEVQDDNNAETTDYNQDYDHLDYLADHRPEITSKPIALPRWLTSFLIGCIVRLANMSEYWHKSWKKIKYTFAKR
jgi:hypothetical protein